MKAGLVSVIIPSYNYGRFVVDAVKSALAQTYPQIEVIVVDDGSTDETAENLRPFSGQIRYIFQPHRGVSAARNAGIRDAHGEWIALLDADDVWHSQKTEIQLSAASSLTKVGLIGSLKAECLPETLPVKPALRSLTLRDFLTSSPTGTTGALIRRECFDCVGLFDEDLQWVEDRDIWLRIAAKYQCVQVLTHCWWYRPHQAQISRRASQMFENYKKVLTKFFNQHPEYAGLRRLAWGYLYFDSGWAFLNEGNRRIAWTLMLKSLYLRPWSLGDRKLRKFIRARILARLIIGDGPFGRKSMAREL
jgi:glycosyltransferase involved in cell wall biosynthesis